MKTFEKSFIKTKPLEKASAKETFRESFIKAQSAMEYLMTYGWAILIIAVVLGALFELGVFNANNFAPKAPPGACQVFRPNGPGTTSFINLEGICTGEIPQYVSQFSSGSIQLPNFAQLYSNSFSWSLWIEPLSWGANNNGVMGQGNNPCGPGCAYMIEQGSPTSPILQFSIDGGAGGYSAYSPISLNIWQNIVGTYNYSSGTIAIYKNGELIQSATSNAVARITGPMYLGFMTRTSTPYYNGSISNVQIYNTSFSANDIQALYLEGIGGAPINLQNLVAWYPLDGNANDYSGNGNNGVPTNVIFVSNWYSSYTPP